MKQNKYIPGKCVGVSHTANSGDDELIIVSGVSSRSRPISNFFSSSKIIIHNIFIKINNKSVTIIT